MPLQVMTVLLATLSVAAGYPLADQTPAAPVRIYSDHAHGQVPLAPMYREIASKLGAEIVASDAAITPQALQGYRLMMLRVPVREITADESRAVVDFVRQGGSLLLVFDEERRVSLSTTRVNDLIAPFGLTLTADTPYVHNIGAVAKKGTINAADRELPYSGGRAVEGGTPFAWQLDKEGQPAQVFAAHTTVGTGGRVVVMAEGMASLFLGRPDGVRLSGVPGNATQTVYWGKDSAIFMEEVLAWLIK